MINLDEAVITADNNVFNNLNFQLALETDLDLNTMKEADINNITIEVVILSQTRKYQLSDDDIAFLKKQNIEESSIAEITQYLTRKSQAAGSAPRKSIELPSRDKMTAAGLSKEFIEYFFKAQVPAPAKVVAGGPAPSRHEHKLVQDQKPTAAQAGMPSAAKPVLKTPGQDRQPKTTAAAPQPQPQAQAQAQAATQQPQGQVSAVIQRLGARRIYPYQTPNSRPQDSTPKTQVAVPQPQTPASQPRQPRAAITQPQPQPQPQPQTQTPRTPVSPQTPGIQRQATTVPQAVIQKPAIPVPSLQSLQSLQSPLSPQSQEQKASLDLTRLAGIPDKNKGAVYKNQVYFSSNFGLAADERVKNVKVTYSFTVWNEPNHRWETNAITIPYSLTLKNPEQETQQQEGLVGIYGPYIISDKDKTPIPSPEKKASQDLARIPGKNKGAIYQNDVYFCSNFGLAADERVKNVKVTYRFKVWNEPNLRWETITKTVPYSLTLKNPEQETQPQQEGLIGIFGPYNISDKDKIKQRTPLVYSSPFSNSGRSAQGQSTKTTPSLQPRALFAAAAPRSTLNGIR